MTTTPPSCPHVDIGWPSPSFSSDDSGSAMTVGCIDKSPEQREKLPRLLDRFVERDDDVPRRKTDLRSRTRMI